MVPARGAPAHRQTQGGWVWGRTARHETGRLAIADRRITGYAVIQIAAHVRGPTYLVKTGKTPVPSAIKPPGAVPLA